MLCRAFILFFEQDFKNLSLSLVSMTVSLSNYIFMNFS